MTMCECGRSTMNIVPPLRLRIDASALVANWRWLKAQSGSAACGAAIKANGYGLGAIEVMNRLSGEGCRDFFVATWDEAASLAPFVNGHSLSVLHGVGPDDMEVALCLPVRPVLNSIEQVARWREVGAGRPCDVMVDTGMNRLGLRPEEVLRGALNGLEIHTLLSHLASADEDGPQNRHQLKMFHIIKDCVPAHRYSLANSAGICLGSGYGFDLTRPGLALYGGVPRREARKHIRQVVYPEARILQLRHVPQGEAVGYNATWTAAGERLIATVNLGYADGYLRSHFGKGRAIWRSHSLPLVGRVSMDLTTFDVSDVPGIGEGDWLAIDYDLFATAERSGLSQYELLTGLGVRYARVWS